MPRGFWEFRCQVKRLIDGDTYTLRIDKGFNDYRWQDVRLRGVDTAEIYGIAKDSEEYRRGQEHLSFVGDWVFAGREGYDGDWPFLVETREPGKYGGRYIADRLVRRSDGQRLANALVAHYPEVQESN